MPRWFVLMTLAAFGQASENDWGNLSRLRPGQKLEVTDAKMKSVRGQFASVNEEGISLQAENGATTIARAEVMSVKDRNVSHRGRNALIGLAVGAAAGVAIGAIRGGTYHEEGETPVFLLAWTPIGAGVGAATGAALPGGTVTIYRKARPPQK